MSTGGKASERSKETSQTTIDRRKPVKSAVERITGSNIVLGQVCALPAVLTSLILLVLTSSANPWRIPLFDAFPSLLDARKAFGVRWDAIHFLSVASHGYRYEQQLAFQPGWHAVLHLAGKFWRGAFGPRSTELAIAQASVPLMWLLAGVRGVLLFRLTEHVISRRMALVATSFYLLAPTPAVLVSPYTEPLYACFTFGGYLLAFRRRFFLASLCLAGATSLRATGIFASPLLAMLAVFPDGLHRIPTLTAMVRRSLGVALPCLIVISPFVAFQIYAYLMFCSPEATRTWCHARVPMAYSFVQAEYWNIGFLNYWTPAQIPNLLIASPVLIVSLTGIARFFTTTTKRDGTGGLPARVTPLIAHHALMTFLLIFGSHTQIALRVISTDPVFWWLLADLAFTPGKQGMTRAGQAWLWWTVIWGAVSIVLWAGHYPPA